MQDTATAVDHSRQPPTSDLGRARYRTTDVSGFSDPWYWNSDSVKPLLSPGSRYESLDQFGMARDRSRSMETLY